MENMVEYSCLLSLLFQKQVVKCPLLSSGISYNTLVVCTQATSEPPHEGTPPSTPPPHPPGMTGERGFPGRAGASGAPGEKGDPGPDGISGERCLQVVY